MFPLETLIFELIVLAILNYIGPHFGRQFLKADALPSKVIFLVAQGFSPSNARVCHVCFCDRTPTGIPTSSWVKVSEEKTCFCWLRSSKQTSLGKWIFKIIHGVTAGSHFSPSHVDSSEHVFNYKWQKPNSNQFNLFVLFNNEIY